MWVLKIGCSDHSSLAVRAAKVMRSTKLLDADNFQTFSGRCKQSSTANSARTQYDTIIHFRVNFLLPVQWIPNGCPRTVTSHGKKLTQELYHETASRFGILVDNRVCCRMLRFCKLAAQGCPGQQSGHFPCRRGDMRLMTGHRTRLVLAVTGGN